MQLPHNNSIWITPYLQNRMRLYPGTMKDVPVLFLLKNTFVLTPTTNDKKP